MTVGEIENFKVLEEHEEQGVKLLVSSNRKIHDKNLLLCDFKQGCVGNCGLISALAALSLRPEFTKEICPVIENCDGITKVHFNMFFEGEPVRVTIDAALPFDENNQLVYSRSARSDRLCLCSFFEKAFVKQACHGFYEHSRSTEAFLAFSCFSDKMTSYRVYEVDETNVHG